MKGVRIGCLATFLLLSASPAFAVPDLNAQLLSAVCRSDWRAAIRVVDSMSDVAPAHRAQLAQYRSQLSAIADSGASFSSPACGSSPAAASRPPRSPGFSSQSGADSSYGNSSLQDYSDSIRR